MSLRLVCGPCVRKRHRQIDVRGRSRRRNWSAEIVGRNGRQKWLAKIVGRNGWQKAVLEGVEVGCSSELDGCVNVDSQLGFPCRVDQSYVMKAGALGGFQFLYRHTHVEGE